MKNIPYILCFFLILIACKQKATKIEPSRDLIRENLKDLSIANQDTLIIITDENEVEEYCFTELDEKPLFQNGDEDLRNYLLKKLFYPEIAIDSNIEGRVVVRFVVMKDGSIEDIKIIRGLSKEIDSICASVFENMPRWKPGKIKDEKANVQLIIPILFKLEDDNEISENVNTKLINEEKKIRIKIYPNPSREFFKVEIQSQFSEVKFQIINLNGKVIKSGSIYSENQQIDVNDLDNGMYIVKFESKEINLSTIEKLIIQK